MTTRCIRCGNLVQGMSQFCDDCAAQQADASGFSQPAPPNPTAWPGQQVGDSAAPAAPATTACPSCGNALPAGAAFCGACGSHVPGVTPSTCTNCGAALTPGVQFCPNCGASAAIIPDYAGFWSRFVALFIDGVILFFLSGIPSIIVAVAVDSIGLVYLVSILITAIYYSWGNGSGGTWGKQVMGLRVVSPTSGDEIGIGAGFGRTIVWWLGSIPFYLGWFWMLWDREKRCWHDHAAGSIVVKARR
jgi:uncharacterized RDD family membrane protein YckC